MGTVSADPEKREGGPGFRPAFYIFPVGGNCPSGGNCLPGRKQKNHRQVVLYAGVYLGDVSMRLMASPKYIMEKQPWETAE